VPLHRVSDCSGQRLPFRRLRRHLPREREKDDVAPSCQSWNEGREIARKHPRRHIYG
jgi:hypothetical protein